ncbi:MAG: hypothetical protein DRP93_02915 [Candidatus Neomarinimicrobiota bacterium]|nr:MAG: hypothetical protein DRP93_02915 [Candidatus Neomarinimicrobiota bacterium]
MAEPREDVPVEDGCSPECNYINWSDIVGEVTTGNDGEPIYVGGGVNDLLYIARQHLASAKSKGQLTAEEMGKAYASVIPAAFKEAINFEMAEALNEFQIQNEKADVGLKESQLESDRNKTEAELEKQWGYYVTRDADGELVLGLNNDEGKIDAETDKIQADVLISEQEVEIAKSKAANEQAQTVANIEKVYGYDCDIDVEGNISVGDDTEDGKLDYDNIKVQEDTQMVKTQIVSEQSSTIASIEKIYGYEYSIDENCNIVMGEDDKDGKYDYENNTLQAGVLIAEQEVLIAQSKESREYAGMIGELDKVLGYRYDLDVDGQIIRDSLVNTEDGKLDYENDLLIENVEIASIKATDDGVHTRANIEKIYGYSYVVDEATGEITVGETDEKDGRFDYENEKLVEDLSIAKAQSANENAKTIANIDKVYGYAYAQDETTGVITIGEDQEDGKLDYENDLLVENIEIANIKVRDDEVHTRANIEKIYGYSYVVDEDTGDITAGETDEKDGRLDYENSKIQEDTQMTKTQIVSEQSQTKANIEKVYGYEYSLDVNDDVVMGDDEKDGKLDYENEKLIADVEIAEAKAVNEHALTIANIDKVYGYDYTDIDGNITIGDNTEDGKLDYDNTLTVTQTEKIVNDTSLSLLSTQLGAWTSSYTSGKLDNRPDILDNEEIECLYDKILGDVAGETCENPPVSPTPPVVGPGGPPTDPTTGCDGTEAGVVVRVVDSVVNIDDGNTYILEGGDSQEAFFREETMKSCQAVTITKANDHYVSIMFVSGFSVASSSVAADECIITTTDGTTIDIRNASSSRYFYNVWLNGYSTYSSDYVSFCSDILGVTVPTSGVVSGGAVTIVGS